MIRAGIPSGGKTAKPTKRKGSGLDRLEKQVFRRWLTIMNELQVPHFLGGAFAVYLHTGFWRDTKDLDIFIRAKDLKTALDAFAGAGYKTRIESRHWLGKVLQGPYLLDLIFGFWNGRMRIDETWIDRCRPAEFAGVPVPLISLEDLIASKVYVASRDRFDGAEIVHLIRLVEGNLDWTRLLDLLGDDYAILLWSLILYDFVYPRRGGDVRELMVRLFQRLQDERPEDYPPSFFRGPLLDPVSFQVSMDKMGYQDPRDMAPLVDDEGNIL